MRAIQRLVQSFVALFFFRSVGGSWAVLGIITFHVTISCAEWVLKKLTLPSACIDKTLPAHRDKIQVSSVNLLVTFWRNFFTLFLIWFWSTFFLGVTFSIMKEISEVKEKTNHVVCKYLSKSPLYKGIGAGGVSLPLTKKHYPAHQQIRRYFIWRRDSTPPIVSFIELSYDVRGP